MPNGGEGLGGIRKPKPCFAESIPIMLICFIMLFWYDAGSRANMTYRNAPGRNIQSIACSYS